MAQSGTVVQGVNVEDPGIRMFAPNGVTGGVAQDKGKDSQHSVTASTTQTQAASSATAQLIGGNNEIETCANANDGVALPQAEPGARCFFFNSGAQACKVFGKSGTTDTINGTAGATGVTGPGAGKLGIAVCCEAGKWKLALSA